MRRLGLVAICLVLALAIGAGTALGCPGADSKESSSEEGKTGT
jgi:hypothetical protein